MFEKFGRSKNSWVSEKVEENENCLSFFVGRMILFFDLLLGYMKKSCCICGES